MKILRSNMTHYNFTYKEGLNEDIIPFNPSGTCKPGGLYFTTIEHIFEFVKYGDNVAIISLCSDAQFYIDPDGYKYKTNKFVIDKIIPFSEYFTDYEQLRIKSICSYSCILSLVSKKDITYDLCKYAVALNSIELNFVPKEHITFELYALAVKHNGYTLKYVPNEYKTLEMCILAVKQCGWAFEYVPDDLVTPEICTLAVKKDGNIIGWIPEKHITLELCTIAVNQTRYAFRWVPDHIKKLMKTT